MQGQTFIKKIYLTTLYRIYHFACIDIIDSRPIKETYIHAKSL